MKKYLLFVSLLILAACGGGTSLSGNYSGKVISGTESVQATMLLSENNGVLSGTFTVCPSTCTTGSINGTRNNSSVNFSIIYPPDTYPPATIVGTLDSKTLTGTYTYTSGSSSVQMNRQ